MCLGRIQLGPVHSDTKAGRLWRSRWDALEATTCDYTLPHFPAETRCLQSCLRTITSAIELILLSLICVICPAFIPLSCPYASWHSWATRPPRSQPVVSPVSPLIRLSLGLVLLIPEGFVYLCWSCFYSLLLTPPIFSPVIWTAGLLCSYSTN